MIAFSWICIYVIDQKGKIRIWVPDLPELPDQKRNQTSTYLVPCSSRRVIDAAYLPAFPFLSNRQFRSKFDAIFRKGLSKTVV